MPRALLNLAGLRASRTAFSISEQDAPGDSHSLTRRRALGLAGVAAAGVSPALHAVETSLLGAFELVRNGKWRVALRSGGLDRWVVDTRFFAGSPALAVQQSTDAITIELRGARYPGTALPADFRCALRRGAGGWSIRLEMTLGGFAASGHLMPWLTSMSALESRVLMPGCRINLGTTTSLDLAGPARAAFRPIWRLELDSKRIAALQGLNTPLVADSLQIALPVQGAASLLRSPSPKRTEITLWRGTRAWNLQPDFQPNGHWRLVTSPNAFSSLVLEIGEDAAGHRSAAMAADGGEGLAFQPHSGLSGPGNSTATLPLRAARYAIAFDPAADHRSLVARFAPTGAWIAAGACALQVGGADGTQPFEIVAHGNRVLGVRCNPAVLSASIPVAGAMSAPARVAAGTHLAFVSRGLDRPGTSHAAQIVLADRPQAAFHSLTATQYMIPQITVVRPSDLLTLSFEFVNLALNVVGDGSTPYLTPSGPPAVFPSVNPYTGVVEPVTQPDGTAYLVVHFPPQSFGERAFFEAEQGLPMKSSVPADPTLATANSQFAGQLADQNSTVRTGPSSPETPSSLQTTALVAGGTQQPGDTRLAFVMPPNFQSLPLTLDNLLNWAYLVPNLPAPALPAGEYIVESGSDRKEPSSTETSLEIPWHLFISPNRYAGWIHSFRPVTHGDWTELWHTRLGVLTTVVPLKTAAPTSMTKVGLTWALAKPSVTQATTVHARANQVVVASKAPAVLSLTQMPALVAAPGHTYLVDAQYVHELQKDAPDGWKYVVTQATYAGSQPVDMLPELRTIRAVWSPSYTNDGSEGTNFQYGSDELYPATDAAQPKNRTSLTGQDRAHLVALTSCYRYVKHAVPGGETYLPAPVDVKRLMLSSLGAWVDFHGAWPNGDHVGVALMEWTHKATQGRDHYVRVVYKGYLFPFGHRATLIKITERKLEPDAASGNKQDAAFLMQRMFIVVREPIRQYPDSQLQSPSVTLGDFYDNTSCVASAATPKPNHKAPVAIDRAMPFKQIQITTITTPDIDDPGKSQVWPNGNHSFDAALTAIDAFWPKVGKEDFLFHCVGHDVEGQRVEFAVPLAFVSVDDYLAFEPSKMLTMQQLYAQDTKHNTVSMHGAKIAYAPHNKPGDTLLPTTDMTFDVYPVPFPSGGTPGSPWSVQWLMDNDVPCFLPIVRSAAVSVPALEAMLHTGQQPHVRVGDQYLMADLGKPGNTGEVFIQTVDTKLPSVAFGASKSGGTGTTGVVTPNLAITGLSRITGPVGGDPSAVGGGSLGSTHQVLDFLQQFFSDDAKILGAVPLSKIINLPTDLSPLYKVLSVMHSLESVPDALDGLLAQALTPLSGNPSSLSNQDRTTVQNALTQVQSGLSALQTALSTLQSALGMLPSLVGDTDPKTGKPLLDEIKTELGTVAGNLDGILSSKQAGATDLAALIQDVATAGVGTLASGTQSLQQSLNGLIHGKQDWSSGDTDEPGGLMSLLGDLDDLQGLNPLPKLKYSELPSAVDTTLKWTPHLKDSEPFRALSNFLTVTAKIHTPTDGSAPSFTVVGELGKIGIDLAGVIYVGFGGMTFSAGSSQKVNVKVDAGVQVMFEGPLSFVNDLKDLIPSDGFNDPPFVDVTDSDVEAGFNFDVPSLTLGMFSLDNISLGAKVTIPFIGKYPAQVYFNFCTRDNPFHLTIAMLGGGGFFGITLGLDGLDMLETALEAGADLSLSFGIASGTISVMAGVYFKMQRDEGNSSDFGTVNLTGYIHFNGGMEVMEIVSVSIDSHASAVLREGRRRHQGRRRCVAVHLRARSAPQRDGPRLGPSRVLRLAERSDVRQPGELHELGQLLGGVCSRIGGGRCHYRCKISAKSSPGLRSRPDPAPRRARFA